MGKVRLCFWAVARGPRRLVGWCCYRGAAARRWADRGLVRLEALAGEVAARPVWAIAAGLLGGGLLGVVIPLSPGLIGSLLAAAVLLGCRWPWRCLQYSCRLAFAGLLLAHLHALWQGRALPLTHVAHLVATQPLAPVSATGTVAQAVVAAGEQQWLYLRLHAVEHRQRWHPVVGLVRLSVPGRVLSLWPGDVVRAEGVRLYRVRGFWNPGSFDLEAYLARQGIAVAGRVRHAAHLHVLSRARGWSAARLLARWRARLVQQVRAALAPPYDGVFLALVLGCRGCLSPALAESFRTAGVAHLFVVSGLHVGFVAGSLFLGWRALLRLGRSWLPRPWLPGWRPTPLAALLSVPGVLLYSGLVGWTIPTTRAALMASASFLALAVQRPYDVPQALVLAAAVVLACDPTAPLSLSFQLSFVAVVAIVAAIRRFACSAGRWRQRLWLGVVASAAAYAATLPLVVAAFRTLPTYGLVANLVLVPLASLLVPAGVVALAVLALWPAVGAWLLVWLTQPLAFSGWLATTVAGLPGAELHAAAPAPAVALGYYALLASLLLPWAAPWRSLSAGLAAMLLLAAGSWHYRVPRVTELHVTFLDVGRGDAIVVRAPPRHHLLIDGGGTASGRFDIGRQVVAPFLWDHRVRRFDLVALTHRDPHHARGLVSLLRLFPTTHLLSNGTPLDVGYTGEVLRAAQRWSAQHHTALEGAAALAVGAAAPHGAGATFPAAAAGLAATQRKRPLPCSSPAVRHRALPAHRRHRAGGAALAGAAR
ncbi:MAG: hypothetical protein KatS3mg131_1017 [Candidatus Tectimicrobiota bacterium]|nr:MAG: hypothetical protein KatS3mg131_1017 [Candidatus Tectomicrobia bacterium]